jgi:hypothetical protein
MSASPDHFSHPCQNARIESGTVTVQGSMSGSACDSLLRRWRPRAKNSVDSHPRSAQTSFESPFLKRARSFRECPMHRLPLRDRTVLADKKVLLIDRFRATREARAAILRSRAVEVHEAEEISGARFLWQPNIYDLVMLDVHRYSSEETREFCEQITTADPRHRIVFMVRAPLYLSRTWPDAVTSGDMSRGQWEESVKRFLAAA